MQGRAIDSHNLTHPPCLSLQWYQLLRFRFSHTPFASQRLGELGSIVEGCMAPFPTQSLHEGWSGCMSQAWLECRGKELHFQRIWESEIKASSLGLLEN